MKSQFVELAGGWQQEPDSPVVGEQDDGGEEDEVDGAADEGGHQGEGVHQVAQPGEARGHAVFRRVHLNVPREDL